MKALIDPDKALSQGLAALRVRYQVPAGFPPEVLAAADLAAKQPLTGHVDRTDLPFVTLDPATSTDLDQAFVIERRGADLILRYAIADVAWFVADGGPIDLEAWRRGMTVYLPDGRAGLYPPVLSENAASLLPPSHENGGPRPAVIFTVAVAPDGAVRLEGAERAVIRSRAKLAYETAQPADLPPDLGAFAARIEAAEDRRGASRVDPPEQEVSAIAGHYQLRFRPRAITEDQNAALSLATNLAVADALQAHHTGLFRVMPDPDARALARLRHTARAFGLNWPAAMSLADYERGLDGAKPKDAAFMLAIRRASAGAGYLPWREGVKPWHAAMAATYAHATAPLRRLADRYVVMAALAVANGQAPSLTTTEAFERLAPIMARADAFAGQLDRAAIDLAEAIMLAPRVGETFSAVVTDIDERGARMQLCDLPIVARVAANHVGIGQFLQVRLVAADPGHPPAAFQRVA
jgi:exoribonuclease R